MLANIWTKSLFILYNNCYSTRVSRCGSKMESANFTDLLMIDLNHSILEVISSKMPCLYFISLYISMNFYYTYKYIYICAYVWSWCVYHDSIILHYQYITDLLQPIPSLRLLAPFNVGQRGTALIGLDVQSSVAFVAICGSLWQLMMLKYVKDVEVQCLALFGHMF